MCALCGVLRNEHWADDGGGRRDRVIRTALLERVLAPVRARRARVGGAVRGLATARAARRSSTTSSAVWAEAERLAGRPLDPLDPELVEALAS